MARRRDDPAPRSPARARPWPRVRRCAWQRCGSEGRARPGAEGGRGGGAPSWSEPDGARSSEPRRPRVSGGRSRGARRSGRRRRRKRPGARPAAAAVVAGRAAGASGRRGQRDPRRERMQTAGRARRRGGIVSGGIPPLLPAPNLPGTSGGPGSGASKLWSWPGAHWPSCASPGSKGGRVPCEPGQTRVTGPGSRPARLPPRPRVWGASRRAAVGPAARGVLGGAGRRSPPIARCLPALSLPDSRLGKVSRKRDSAPRPPAPRAAQRHCPSPSRGRAPWTRGLNHHLYP